MTNTARSGHGWAWAGFAIGITASVLANITHSYLVQVERNQASVAGPLVSAAFWPLALYLCLEVMSRVRWPRGWRWWVVRYIGLSAVSFIAAIVSWRHMNGLLIMYGEDYFIALIGPAGVDGLMVLCSAALLAIADNVKRAHQLAPQTMVEPPAAVVVPVKTQESEVRTSDPSPPEASRARKTAEAIVRAPTDPDELLVAARQADAAYRSDHDGRPITRDALRAALRIGGVKANALLKQLRAPAGEAA